MFYWRKKRTRKDNKAVFGKEMGVKRLVCYDLDFMHLQLEGFILRQSDVSVRVSLKESRPPRREAT